MISRLLVAAILVMCLLSGPAYSVVIATYTNFIKDDPNANGNETAPLTSVGWWDNLGQMISSACTKIYLRNGWVVSAGHCGSAAFMLNKVKYSAVPGSAALLNFYYGESDRCCDLIFFKVLNNNSIPKPDLPEIALTSTPLDVGDLVYMAGFGRSGGASTEHRFTQDIPDNETYFEHFAGWEITSPSGVKRWGTNIVDIVQGQSVESDPSQKRLQVLGYFDDLTCCPAGTGPIPINQHEAKASSGDSGGGLFTVTGESVVLHVIMTNVDSSGGGLTHAEYGDSTIGESLSRHAVEMEGIMDVADCANGLDDDGDGRIDTADLSGCLSGADTLEYTPGGAMQFTASSGGERVWPQ